MNHIECDYRDGDNCLIASRLAGRPSLTRDKTCEVCMACDVPMADNYVTASIAMSSIRINDGIGSYIKSRRELAGLLLVGKPCDGKCGCHLERIISSMGIKRVGGCGCEELEALLNFRGPQWCRENLDDVVDKLVETLQKRLADEKVEAAGDEPMDHNEKIPWWIKCGHRLGASKMVGRRIVLLAIDRASKDAEERAEKRRQEDAEKSRQASLDGEKGVR